MNITLGKFYTYLLKNPKSVRIKDVKQFFRPLVPTCMSEVAENNEIPLADFRLKGTILFFNYIRIETLNE